MAKLFESRKAYNEWFCFLLSDELEKCAVFEGIDWNAIVFKQKIYIIAFILILCFLLLFMSSFLFNYRREFVKHGNFSSENIGIFLDDIEEDIEETSCSPLWLPALLIFFMVFGILINAFILLTFIQLPRTRTFTNYFVASLALADILMVILNPILSLLLLYEKVEFEASDSLQFFSEIFCSMASLISFACISLDRMLAIAKPLYHRTIPRSRVIKVIVLIWIFSVIWTLLDFVVSEETEEDVIDGFVFTCCNFCIAFAIPTLITLISYSIIAKVVICRRRETLQETDRCARSGVKMKHTIRITWKIVLVILPGVISWCVYWVPVFIDYRSEREESFSRSFNQIRSLVPMFVAVVNPFIFTLLTPEFHNHLLKFISRRSRNVLGRVTNTARRQPPAATTSV